MLTCDRRRSRSLAALLVTMLVFAACDDDGDDTGDDTDDEVETPAASEDQGSDEAVDVCSIVSQAEAAEALGLAVLEGEASVANFTDSTCRWPAENGFGEVSVRVRSGDPVRFTEFYESAAGEPVAGLGDRAKWDSIQGLEVLTSDYYVGVFTINFSEDEAIFRERSVALAEAVLSRLP